MKRLTSAQMNALRYAARGELWVDGIGTVWAGGRVNPVTAPVRALAERGLVMFRGDAAPTWVPTDAGRELLAGED